MTTIAIAVVGGGHLGRIHARLLQSLNGFDLVGVVDPDPQARHVVERDLSVDTYENVQPLLDQIQAAVVAAPTTCHCRLAGELLSQGVHTLVEKPLAVNLQEADELVRLAAKHHCVLQVGHVERFNAAFTAARPHLGECKYIEAARTSGFTMRSVDIGVVLDLMIHDIDLVLALNRAPVVDVQALGFTVLGPHEDMAQARLTLANGCVANLTASRTSFVAQRQLKIFHDGGFASLDLGNNEATLVVPHPLVAERKLDVLAMNPLQRQNVRDQLFTRWLPRIELDVPSTNAILEEQRDFHQAITDGQPVQVPGTEGRDALAVAERILQAIAEHRWNGLAAGPRGPHYQRSLLAARPAEAA